MKPPLFLFTALFVFMGCVPQNRSDDLQAPGVSWTLAQDRAERISDIRYEQTWQLPVSPTDPISVIQTVSFQLTTADTPILLDFTEPAESVLVVEASGEPVAYTVANEHIIIPAEALHVGENALTLQFLAGSASLNRREGYLYALFVPDRARMAFPCFDQPNLKARYRLTLEMPEAWTAVANAPLAEETISEGQKRRRFAETEPISTYLFAFAAGEFQTETTTVSGREMTMYHRETDAEKVARNAPVIFDLHAQALAWLEDYTGIPYPFAKFDFVLIPGFQFGGMEHPGAILYRARSLFLDASATQSQRLGRASLIAHETAHMWFGDLVTMQWFNDVWTKEVFANFMAAKIVNPAFPEVNHELRFLLRHYPSAYGVDRTEGTHPIRQDLDNMNDAGSLYGALVYQKSPIVMRQLETLVGPEAFREGLQAYLRTFSYRNATWPDLIALLDERSTEDLTTWSTRWVEEAGRPNIQVIRAATDAGDLAEVIIHQEDPLGQGRAWNQQMQLLLGFDDRFEHHPLHLKDAQTTVDIAGRQPNFILANGAGVGYGGFRLDDASRAYLLAELPFISDEIVRATAWINLWESLLAGDVAPTDLMDLLLRALPEESIELNTQQLLGYLSTTYWRFLTPEQRRTYAPTLEEALFTWIEEAPNPSLKLSYFNTFQNIVLTDEGVRALADVWRKELDIPDVTFSTAQYTNMAFALAVRGVSNAEEILDTQFERITNPDRQTRFTFIRPAASADESVRRAFFDTLHDVENRRQEPWALQAINLLHHPLRAESARALIRPSLDLLAEIKRTGDIFFPKRWLDATLGGHQSPEAAQIVRAFLTENPNLSPRLRGKLLQSADLLFRAADIINH